MRLSYVDEGCAEVRPYEHRLRINDLVFFEAGVMAVDFSSPAALTAVYVVLSTGYLWRIVARQSAGLARFVCYLPVLLVNMSLPLLYETEGVYANGRFVCAYYLSWLSSYKVVCLVHALV